MHTTQAEGAGAGAGAASAVEIGRRWTKEEDQQLRDGVEALGPANWKVCVRGEGSVWMVV